VSQIRRMTLEPAYILHRRPYRDSSLVLEILSSSHGRIALVARGARRPKRRAPVLLELFQPLHVSGSGRGELGTLHSAEPRGVVNMLSGRMLLNGFYVNELLLRTLHRDDPCNGIFAAYELLVTGLATIQQTESAAAPAAQRLLRLFEKRLLQELGYGLLLAQDAVSAQGITSSQVYEYHLSQGPVAVAQRNLSKFPSGSAVRIHGSSLQSLAADELRDVQSLREAKYLMRLLLGALLGDKPLYSRSLFAAAQYQSAGI